MNAMHNKKEMKILGRWMRKTRIYLLAMIVLAAQLGVIAPGGELAKAADNGLGAKPYMGWSSYSMQVYSGNGQWITAEQIKAQSDAMHEKLQPYGYEYINVDAAWNGGMDGYGRPIPSTTLYPDGLQEVIDHVHANGQKFGLYGIPGLSPQAYEDDLPIYDAPGCSMRDIAAQPLRDGDYWGLGYKMDFSNPCAQKYIDSIANLYGEWGVDFLKFDSVTPGSGISDLSLDARDDVKAWSEALKPHDIWLELSWALDIKYIDYWKKYANGWRVDWDVECYCGDDGLTAWPSIARLFPKAEQFWRHAGPGGWNDFDSLNVGNGAMDGITEDERRTAMTFWSISAAQLYTGNDMTKLDSFGLELLTNEEVIAVNQAGRPAHPVSIDTEQQVWYANNGDGSLTVGLFNLGSAAETVTVNWSDIGLNGPATVRDLWTHEELGELASGYSSAELAPHASRLLKVTAKGGALAVNDDDTGMRYTGDWTRNGGREMTAGAQNLIIDVSNSTAVPSTINPAAAAFDKKETEQADVVTTLTLNGNTLVGISSGGSALTKDTDYTVDGNQVTVKKEYLAARPVGTASLTFAFSGGAAQNLAVAITDSTTRDSKVTPTTVSFDKKDSAGSDLELTLALNGNALNGIAHEGTSLTSGTDYTTTDQKIVLKKSFLETLPAGTTTLTVSFNAGAEQAVSLVTRDTSVGASIALNNDHAAIHYVGGWNRSYNRGLGDYLDDVHFAEKNDSDYFEYTFTGTGIELITELDPSQGEMDIYVDGEFQQTVNTYNLGRAAQQPVYHISGLEYGEHTLKAVKKSGIFMLLDMLRVSLPDLIGETEANFNKADGQQADVTIGVTAAGSGFGLSGIKNGAAALAAGTDYSVADDVVTIKKEYLAAQQIGTASLVFAFNGGAEQKLAVRVQDTSAANSTINPAAGSFDRKTDAQSDLATTMQLAGNTLVGILNGETALASGTDYTVAGNEIVIKKEYLSTQPVGMMSLTFRFSNGEAQTLLIAVSDTTALNSQLSNAGASFDKNAAVQADVTVGVALNGNSLSAVTNGGAALTEGDDYTLSGTQLTIKRSYLAEQPTGMANLVFSFSAGADQQLAIAVIDTSRGRYVSVNNDDSEITYIGAWQHGRNRGIGDFKDDVQYTEKNNDYFEYTFKGTGIELITEKDSSQGDMDIYVDGEFKQTVSAHNEGRLVQQTVYAINGLSSGTHTIKAVKKSGYYMLLDRLKIKAADRLGPDSASFDKGSASPADVTTTLAVDGSNLQGIANGSTALTEGMDYVVSGDQVAIKKEYLSEQPEGTLSLSFSFMGDSHNDVHYTETDGDEVEYTFTGSGAELIMPKGPTQGDVDIYVDGHFKETVSAYHASRLTQQTVSIISGLSEGVHTIKAVKKSGAEMIVDGLRYSKDAPVTTPTPTPTPTVPTPTPTSPPTVPTPTATPVVTPSPSSTPEQSAPYIKGYEDGTFRPDNKMTRAEMASILSRISEAEANVPDKAYSDVSSTHWAKNAISSVTRMGLMGGYEDGTFGVDKPITRAEMAKLVSMLAGDLEKNGTGFSDISGHWAEGYILKAQGAGILNGYSDGTFRPNQVLTRAEAVTMINRALGKDPASGEGPSPWKDVPSTHWAYNDIVGASAD